MVTTSNNNLSVLPWYKSLEEQNARKWWVYGKVYPLFTPAGRLLPFQIMRERKPLTELDNLAYNDGYLTRNGNWIEGVKGYGVTEYSTNGAAIVHLIVPKPHPRGVIAVALDKNYNVLDTFFVRLSIDIYEGTWCLPIGTAYIRVQTYNSAVEVDSKAECYSKGVSTFRIYKSNGSLVTELNPADMGFTIKPFEDLGYDVIVYPESFPVISEMGIGQHYAMLSDGEETWYSEMFTVVNDTSGCIKLSWWDDEDFVMDAGVIVYKEPEFRNVLYLCTDIAKPEYDFDDEVIQRGGYTFPVEQISKKRYKFSFLASEYLLDVMRLIRMADHIRIVDSGKLHKKIDTFLISPEWEDYGDVASVKAEFTTETVAKKNGRASLSVSSGDFNNDFNNDYN